MIVEQLINGLSLGSIYALIALGYSMVYGIVKLINFAHGDIIMVGAYMVFYLYDASARNNSDVGRLPLMLALLLTIIICAVAGVLIHRLAYDRLLKHDAPKISLLITAIGVSIFIQNLIQAIFSSSSKSVSNLFKNFNINSKLSLNSNMILNIVVSIVVMVVLLLLVKKTRVGKAMRACSEDPDAAKLMGINSNLVVAVTFAVGSAIAGVGAILFVNSYSHIDPFVGGTFGVKAFVAAVLGGIGSIPGAMVGGYLLGIIESLTKATPYSEWADTVVFAILILVLLFKPTGILGKTSKEKV